MHKPQVLKSWLWKIQALQDLFSSGETDSNYSSILFFLEHNSNDHFFFSLPKYLEILYITFGKFIGMMLLTVIIDTEA